MKDSYDQLPSRLQIKESKKELKKEEEEVELVKKEKQQLLEQLAERAKLEDQEKRDILAKLKENDDRLHAAQREVELLRNQLRSKQMGKEMADPLAFDRVRTYLPKRILPQMGTPAELATCSPSDMSRKFSHIRSTLPNGFIEDLQSLGHLDKDGQLNLEGFVAFRRVARNLLAEDKSEKKVMPTILNNLSGYF